MEITRDHIEMFKRLEQKVDTLLKVIDNNKEETFLSYQQAADFLRRSRTWIQERLKESIGDIKNVDDFLFKGVDWVRYGNRIEFRQSSLERLKQSIIKQS